MIEGFKAHVRHLEKLLRRRGRSREDAEDVIQETFLRVKQYLDEGNKIVEPQAFLTSTALNLSRDARKREHRHLYARRPLEDLVLPDARPQPEEAAETEQRLERLKRVLNKAGPRTREVFLMHRLYGMTYPQIADHFDISISAIEKHIARAMAALGEELLDP
jgi:RNA polymerase sigma-70 factor (ECF subfamily)